MKPKTRVVTKQKKKKVNWSIVTTLQYLEFDEDRGKKALFCVHRGHIF